METVVFILMVVLALWEWVNVWQGWKKWRWITKPGSMIALILWFSLLGGWQGALLWFGLALVFSLGGDIFLMFSDRFFILGLLSFLIGHVFYIIGFNQTLPPVDLGSLAILAGMILIGAFLYRIIYQAIKRNPENAGLAIPVLVYSTIIALMSFSAISTLLRPDWPMEAAIFAAFGGMLFFISDSTLAIEKFVRRFPYSGLIVMVTYLLAQFCLAYSALLRF